MELELEAGVQSKKVPHESRSVTPTVVMPGFRSVYRDDVLVNARLTQGNGDLAIALLQLA
jgi:hypothetical protein